MMKFPFIVMLVVITSAVCGCARSERDKSSECLNNMRQFDSAKYSYSMANNVTNGTVLSEIQIQEIGNYIKGGWKENTCPADGKYNVGAIGEDVKCSTHGGLVELSREFKRK